jgi:hypothetical protein
MIKNSSVVMYLPDELIQRFTLSETVTYYEEITEKPNEVANITEKSSEAVNITEKPTAGNNKTEHARLLTRALRHSVSIKLKL